MKPIKLVIKGLNSFIEEQTIDFNKLTDRGLFGIFGPTGSGKSTILDGITLALYGDIARKSSNFINTNCNDLNVSFTFQISGSPNRVYMVSRHFKRDKKTGNAKTHSAIVKEITDGNQEILAESVTTVNKTCREILGLSLEDFTRTVVLPQGKFSEFLKLEGKQRREMLERLFNLQEYGDKLAIKLSREMSAQKDEANKLLGELNTYEGISDEKLEEQKQELAVVTTLLEETKAKQNQIEERYKKGEEIWNMQNQLVSYKTRQAQLEGQAEEVEEWTKAIKQGESAAKVYPFLEGCEKTQTELKEAKEEYLHLEALQKALELQKKQVEEAYQIAYQDREENLPDLQSRGTQLAEAIEETRKLIELEKGIGEVELGLQKVIQMINKYSQNETLYANQLEQINLEISKLQQEERLLKVEENVRTKVQEGLTLLQVYDSNQKTLDRNIIGQNESLEIKKAIELEKQELATRVEEKKIALQKQLELQIEHLKNVPITREDLLQKQEQFATVKEKASRLVKLQEEMQVSQLKLQDYQKQKEQLVAEYEQRKADLESTKAEVEKAKLENLAHLLRANLHDGSACPVCGSTSHHLETLKEGNAEILTQLEEQLDVVEKHYKASEKALTEVQMHEGAESTQLKRLQEECVPLETLFKELSLEEQEKQVLALAESLNQFELKKETLDQEASLLREEVLKLEAGFAMQVTKQQENQKQLNQLAKEIEALQKEMTKAKGTLDELANEIETEDFLAMSQEILAKDRKREEILALITKQTEVKEKIALEQEENQKHLNERKLRLGNGVTVYDEKQKQKQELISRMGKRLTSILKSGHTTHLQVKENIEHIIVFLKEQSLLNELLKGHRGYSSVTQEEQTVTLEILKQWFDGYPVVGEAIKVLGNNLSDLMNSMNEAIEAIEKNFIVATTQKEEVTTKYEIISKQLVEVTTKVEAFTKRLEVEVQALEHQLREENLTKEEVKLYLMPKEQLEVLKQKVAEYQEEKTKLIGSIEAIKGKLGGQSLEESEWLSLQAERQDILTQVEEITKSYINLTTFVKQIETALNKLGELRDKKQKLDHRIAILSDLDKLFKGKRFVEFVATTRLKRVSLEASKKLREITNGIYGLEVDESGKFLIRDYKNGGARRDASTLSGGETFLASLALALALSAEIQLKGTAPLELFFLDEGFGTLDDDLLDIVMSSLEKIHHEKLKVGIISHVEAIKNRVPVKLILTPAESGKGGTKVKLERS